MGDATYAIPNFHGGEISPFAQGRFDKPDYRTSLNVCLNGFPNEIGTWTPRPGTMYAGHTRAGAAGRTIKFDFEQDAPVTLEFTAGFLRFRSGATLVTGNDAEVVVAVSAANPAVVQTAGAVAWNTDDTLVFPGASTALLENRQFIATKIDGTHFSLADAITGLAIDGAALGALAAGATVARVHELTTIYSGDAWAALRAVQAETTDILLSAINPPQALTVATSPSEGINPEFEIARAVFNDGPYLDPPINGVQITPSGSSGLVGLTLTFPAYIATKAYAEGAFVTYSSTDYISLADQNVGNTPGVSPAFWAPTSTSTAINEGRGFLATDIGRLVRLLAEPPAWSATTPYAIHDVVSYNPSGIPGASTYWQAGAVTTGTPPGSELTVWNIIASGAAIWTWGRITGLSNIIDRALPGSVAIGDMTGYNGIEAPFDGQFTKVVSQCAFKAVTGGSVNAGAQVSITGYVGKNYSAAGGQRIKSVTVYPAIDRGFGFNAFISANPDSGSIGSVISAFCVFTLNLRANMIAPTSAADGVHLGQISFSGSSVPATIESGDQTTAWNYVWIELIATATAPVTSSSYSVNIEIAQISFLSPTSIASGSAGCTMEVLGPPLLYTTPVVTWRLGAYSDTTGYPTCGTYYEGRIWLGGAVANRFDACVSNGIVGGTIDFAPTNQYGVVAASSAISYTLNSDSSNPIFWMQGEEKGITCGTQASEWLVVAPTNGPLAPTNIAARRVTRHGCANIEPRRTEHTLIFVKRYRRKLLEFFSDVNFGKFSAPNLADKAGHIVSTGIAEIAYTDAVVPVIWGRDDAGALFGITYKRDTLTTTQPPAFAAWHRHALGSGRLIESICAGPSADGELDSLTMVTSDETGLRHVELLTDTPDENTELADAWFLDSAVEPTSTSIDPAVTDEAPYGGLILNGLWHLNGKTVQVFASGLDCGDRGTQSSPGYFTDFVVSDGSCFVPFGDGIDAGCGHGLFTAAFIAANPRIIVGFTYNSDGQLVRPIAPADTGARNGPALGKTRRNHQYSVLVNNTLGISFGASFSNLYPALFRQADGNPIAELTMFSGVHHDTLADDYSYDGMVAWRVSRPWPANIVAISGNIQTQDR